MCIKAIHGTVVTGNSIGNPTGDPHEYPKSSIWHQPAAARIEGVLFDFGGVFMDSPFAAVQAFGDSLGIGGDQILEYVFGRYDEDTDHPWHRLERGELSIVDAREQILQLALVNGHEVDIFRALGGMAGAAIRDAMVDAARVARASGRKVAMITNNVREFGDSWRAMLPVDELFDLVIDSHQVGVRKPNPRIFELALEGIGDIAPQNTVFLDDFGGNIAAATKVGIRGILVGSDWRSAVAELRGLLGLDRDGSPQPPTQIHPG